MKKTIFVMLLHCFSLSAIAQKNNSLPDGIYLVDSIFKTTQPSKLNTNKVLLQFDAAFSAAAPAHAQSVTVFRNNYVPLQLDSVSAVLHLSEHSQRLGVYFDASAANTLETFTGAHIMRQAALVVDGKVLTVQTIKAKIVGGKLEISRNGDDVCEQLHTRLKASIRH